MRRLPAVLIATTLLLGGLAACSDDGGDDPNGSAQDTTSTTEAEPIEVELEVLDAGAEPRQALRLAPADDCATSTTTATTSSTTAANLGAEPVTTTSSTELDLTWLCTEVTEDRIEFVRVFDDYRNPDDPGNAELYTAMRGTEITVAVDRLGNVLDVETGPEATGGDEIADQVRAGAVPLPEEPVGVGARWRTSSPRSENGIPSTLVTEYEVTRIEGTIVEAAVTSTETYTVGPFRLSTPNGEIPGEVVDGEVLGSGTITWDLSTVTTYSDQTVSGSSHIRAEASDQDLDVTRDQELHVVVTPRTGG